MYRYGSIKAGHQHPIYSDGLFGLIPTPSPRSAAPKEHSPTIKMSDLEQIKTEIATTKAELATAKRKLAEAEEAGDEAKIAKYEDEVNVLRGLLTRQQEKENLLMKTSEGNASSSREFEDQVSNADAVLNLLRERLRGSDLVQSVAEVCQKFLPQFQSSQFTQYDHIPTGDHRVQDERRTGQKRVWWEPPRA
jgi:hypothetical protein